MARQPADTGLPIEQVVGPIRAALIDRGIAVLTAEPGAGKTTVVPLRLLDEPWLDQKQKIVVLEPRRVAARAVARRMASLLGENVGQTVGWRTRDDRRIGSETRIEVVTEGILTRRLQSDPTLPGVGALLFDEFHERSVHADLGLALALEAREALRDDLRILIMSATIDADAIAKLIGDPVGAAPIVSCPGRSFPIDIKWSARKKKDRLEDIVTAGVGKALNQPGDVLVFLPGIGEIRRSVDQLRTQWPELAVVPLYGGLDSQDQDAALQPHPDRRKVVVSTDVAETSLTVEGIGSVVDSGVARRPRYDPASGLSKLVTVTSSKASADQRAGRAGRLGPGLAIRLWSKVEHASRPRHESAEILQIDLASLLLETKAWGVNQLSDLRLLDQPSEAAIADASEVLTMLGAIDQAGRVTTEGMAMLKLPLHPRLAAMLVSAGDGPLASTAAVLAGLLSERDVIGGRPAERPVDLWSRVQLVVDREFWLASADGRSIQTARKRAEELARRAGLSLDPAAVHADDLGRTLAMAYPDRLAQKRAGQGGRFRLRTGLGAEINRSDPMAHEAALVVAEVSGNKRNARILRAAAIDPIDIELGFSSEITEHLYFGWDNDRNDLTSRAERRLGSLDLGTHDQPVESSEAATEALLDHLRDSRLTVLKWSDEARNLQARVAFANKHQDLFKVRNRNAATQPDADTQSVTDTSPGSSTMKSIADDFVMANVAEVFGDWLDSATGRCDLEQLDVDLVLRTYLGWDFCQSLDDQIPASYELPNGRTVSINYSADPPRISTRAQNLYPLTESPTLFGGAVPIACELLSPADRPIQITSDLAGFWNGSWEGVRKDMASRYPKHDWPVNPQEKQ